MLDALATALRSPLNDDDDMTGMDARLAALAATPLDDAALLAVAGCSGEPSILAKQLPTGATHAQLRARCELARQRALSHRRLALAVAGSRALGDAARTALRQPRQWPDAPAPGQLAGPRLTGHTSYHRAAAHAALEISVWFHDAHFAASLTDPSRQLPIKLALVAPALHGALPRLRPRSLGGCVRLHLSARPSLERRTLRTQAAAAVAVVIHEAQRTAERPTPFGVASVLAALPNAAHAATRAARWALSYPAEVSPPVVASALGISAANSQQPLDTNVENARFATQLRAQRNRLIRHRDEQTMGVKVVMPRATRIWMLIGKPCALHRESRNDAGLAAMTALAFAGDGSGIDVQPYITPYGVGVMASHVLDPDAEPGWQAQHFGRALAATVLRAPDQRSITRAQRRWQALRAGDGNAAERALARLAYPERASLLLPWAGVHDVVPSLEEVQDRWREMLAQRWRLATVAPTDEVADTAAAAALEALPTPARAAPPCGEVGVRLPPSALAQHPVADGLPPPPFAGAATTTDVSASRWWLALLPGSLAPSRAYGTLAALRLTAPGGAFRQRLRRHAPGLTVRADVLGSGRVWALRLQLSGGPLTQVQLLDALAAARTEPLTSAMFEQLTSAAKNQRDQRVASPPGQLLAAWAGDFGFVPPDIGRFRDWWQHSLAPNAVKRVARR
ncbi:MAG TPA: hypothetical protein ENK23_04855 [Sorangium sp.]|nr:hypothetical protein [Sorangium sp.]